METRKNSMNEVTIKNDQGETVTIKVGDFVGFKSDVEQGGQVSAIRAKSYGSGYTLTLTSEHGFHGEYIGGELTTEEDADRVWTD